MSYFPILTLLLQSTVLSASLISTAGTFEKTSGPFLKVILAECILLSLEFFGDANKLRLILNENDIYASDLGSIHVIQLNND